MQSFKRMWEGQNVTRSCNRCRWKTSLDRWSLSFSHACQKFGEIPFECERQRGRSREKVNNKAFWVLTQSLRDKASSNTQPPNQPILSRVWRIRYPTAELRSEVEAGHLTQREISPNPKGGQRPSSKRGLPLSTMLTGALHRGPIVYKGPVDLPHTWKQHMPEFHLRKKSDEYFSIIEPHS